MSNYKCQTPILLLFFNRLDTAVKVFERIREAQPKSIYLACDGARSNVEGEAAKVEALRSRILSMVDWDCEVKTLFRKENLGCQNAVNNAITWFFENVESGIILEDDTVPDLSFFPYCEELLTKYAEDERIGMISGNNHLTEYAVSDSYLFSKFKWTWGWATWRRAWLNQDVDLKMMQSEQASSILKNMGYGPGSERRWETNLRRLGENKVGTWDYQWFLAMAAQNQLSIIPRNNLVANIGFGVDGATHCTGSASDRYVSTMALEFPLKHPEYVVPDYGHEVVYETMIVGDGRGYGRFVPKQIRGFIKKLLLKLK